MTSNLNNNIGLDKTTTIKEINLTTNITTSNPTPSASQIKVTPLALKIIKSIGKFIAGCFYYTTLLIAKVVIIPVIITACLVTGIFAVITLPWAKPLQASAQPTLHHHLCSLTNDFSEIAIIALKFGLPYKNEWLQKADDAPKSPEFILIQPKNLIPSKPPILYAPGYLDEAETLRSTCRKIANKYGAPVYIVKYSSYFQSIDDHSNDISRVVNRIVKDTGTSDLTFIGHSMGGLATGNCISKNSVVNVNKWITVGSPLSGTKIAKWGMGKCAVDMRPNSVFLTTFNQNQVLQKIPSLHVYTLTDHVVPFKSSAMINQTNSVVCSRPYGHLGMRSSHEVIDTIVKSI